MCTISQNQLVLQVSATMNSTQSVIVVIAMMKSKKIQKKILFLSFLKIDISNKPGYCTKVFNCHIKKINNSKQVNFVVLVVGAPLFRGNGEGPGPLPHLLHGKSGPVCIKLSKDSQSFAPN